MEMMGNDVEMKKEVLEEIMDLMTKLGYEKMKKPVSMEVEVASGDECEMEEKPEVEVSEDSGDVEEMKKRLKSRFGK